MGFRFPGQGQGQGQPPEGDDFGPPPPPFRIRRRGFDLSNLGGVNRLLILGVSLVLLYIVLNVARGIYVDLLWFDGAGYESVYKKIITTRVLLFLGGAGLFAVLFGLNAFLAGRVALKTPAVGLAEAEATSLRRIYLLGLIAATLFLAVIFGTIAAGHWEEVLIYLNSEPFGVVEEQFNRDVGFYVFTLPALRALQGWLMGLAVLTTLLVAGLYLFRYMVAGAEEASGRWTKAHVCLLLVAVIALFVWRYWLDFFELNFSEAGFAFGAAYTDVHARLPFLYIGMALGVGTAVTLLYAIFRQGILVPAGAMAAWAVILVVGGAAYPAFVQRFSVEPNELEKERVFIERNIEMTRNAFGLKAIDERQFPAREEVLASEIAENAATINNIRLLDEDPLLQTYGQIQTIRPLYEFRDVDIDRYMINGQLRQVMISARELSSANLPANRQNWVNRRLEFTHGYGVVMSPVNQVVEEGLPDLFLKDIPIEAKTVGTGADIKITGALPVTEPRIYYGEEPEHYVIVKTSAQEFDFPIGESGQARNVFGGEGGVGVGSFFRKLVFAWEFSDINIARSGSLTGDSRILFRRNIQERVDTIAPFLTLDRDPYMVIADGKFFWIQDAYTTTDRYPYSTPSAGTEGLVGVNYIRNSVKVVIDAYDGTTTFYLNDPTDPIIRVYDSIFPDLLTPLEEMPASLRAHMRYPADLFLVQVNQYRIYHLTDAGVLFSGEDIWRIAREATDGARVDPYYLIMQLPGEAEEEFVLILPMSPRRPRENTIAWVAARSDGEHLGKLVAFRFPTDLLVFGPSQVESRIDQNTAISQQFSLWDRSGSQVIRGNLLMIPIGEGNLFVEPIYLQAETSRLPELKRIVVANGNQIAMEETLEQSLKVIFGEASATLPGTTPTAPPQATPTATPTPAGPTATPRDPGDPGSLSELARQAEEAFQRAEDALRRGDFATYGVEIELVESLIRRIVELSGGS